MICVLETAASYGPKSALVLDEPVYKHGSGVADRLVMTSAEQRSDLDQETARIRASGRVLRLQGEDHGEASREAGAQIDGVATGCGWHNSLKRMVGASGFEPETSCAQGLSARKINHLHRTLRIATKCDKCNADRRLDCRADTG